MPRRVSLPDIYMLQTFFPTLLLLLLLHSGIYQPPHARLHPGLCSTLCHDSYREWSKEKIQNGKRSGCYVYEEASEGEVAQSCPTLCNPVDYSPPGSSLSLGFPRQEYRSGFLLQGIFLTQGSNQHLPHCKQILYRLSHQESPMKKQGDCLKEIRSGNYGSSAINGLWHGRRKIPAIPDWSHIWCSPFRTGW